MLKRIRDLFFPGEGAPETDDGIGDDGVRRLWVSLIRLGAARGLALPDAEDLAQESIVAGMQSFEPARGDFGAFCRAILSNKALNFHRAARPLDPLPEDDRGFVDPDEGPGWALYRRQCRERADRIVAETVSSLDEEAAAFFLILAEVHGELSHGEVSEAARRAGVSPQQGWDIFRRIQRRFKGLEGEVPIPECPPSRGDGPRFLPRPIAVPSDLSRGEAEGINHLRSRYRHFSAELGTGTRRRLRSLLRR